MPYRLGRALAYAVSLWLTGFIWGSIVFMTPGLAYLMLIIIPWMTGRSLQKGTAA